MTMPTMKPSSTPAKNSASNFRNLGRFGFGGRGGQRFGLLNWLSLVVRCEIDRRPVQPRLWRPQLVRELLRALHDHLHVAQERLCGRLEYAAVRFRAAHAQELRTTIGRVAHGDAVEVQLVAGSSNERLADVGDRHVISYRTRRVGPLRDAGLRSARPSR